MLFLICVDVIFFKAFSQRFNGFAGFMIIVYAAPSTLMVFGVAKLPLVH